MSFWDKLDYIGANPYISFTDSPNPDPAAADRRLDQAVATFWHVQRSHREGFGENISAIDALRRIARSTARS